MPEFWTFGDVCSGLQIQSQSGLPHLCALSLLLFREKALRNFGYNISFIV